MKTETGFSLLEIFLTLWLGSMITVNLLIVFVTFYHNVCLQAELTAMQENGRFITYFLTKQIRSAGDASCIHDQWVNRDKAMGGEVLQLGECILYHGHRQFMQTQYFVDDSGRKNFAGEAIYSLYMKTIGSEREELIENVKSLQIRYGVTLFGQQRIAAYVPANQVTDWNLVRSVDATLIFVGDKTMEKPWHFYATLRERI